MASLFSPLTTIFFFFLIVLWRGEACEPFACDPKNAATRGLSDWKVDGGRKSELVGEQCGGSSTAWNQKL